MAAVLSTSAEARAAPPVASVRPPAGWAPADAQAQQPLSRWLADRSDARVVAAYSPTADDDFAELIAVLELTGPLTDDVAPGPAFVDALAGMPGIDTLDPSTVIVEEHATGPRLRGSWRSDMLALHAELVPTGTTCAVILQITLASEAALYARTFDDVRATIVGAAAPVRAFDTSAWRLRVAAIAIAIAGAFAVAMWRRPSSLAAKTTGRLGAVVIAALTGLFAWLATDALALHTASLAVVGTTADRLVAEIVVVGLVAALGFWIAGQALSGGDGQVASAPQRGAFADRSSPQLTSTPVIPQLPPKAARTRPTHPDGPSRLDAAGADAPAANGDHTPL